VNLERLAELPPLNVLSASSRAAIAGWLSSRRVEAGELVFGEGDPSGPLYILESGSAEVILPLGDQELLLATLEAPTFFGGMSFIGERPRSSAIRARTRLDLIAVPAEVLPVLEEHDPRGLATVYRACFQMTAEHLRRANGVTLSHFRQQRERQAQEESERELRHLLVHDLRSPLAICETGLRQLMDRPDRYSKLDERSRRLLERALRSARFMRRLVEEILEVGRTESGAERLERTTLADLLREALPQAVGGARGPDLSDLDESQGFEPMRRALAAEDIHIEAPAGVLEAPLVVDRFRLMQVVMNLVGNALKHAPGWLAIRVERVDDRARVSVVDRGPGVPEQLRAALFQPYQQAEVKTQGVRRGFGLGLAGAARLVEGLGGSIRAETGDGGEGLAIHFDLPWKT
jgi:signal transduction histidine kinase